MNNINQERIDACLRAFDGIKNPETFMKDVLTLIRGINTPVYEMLPVIRRLQEAILNVSFTD